jgi:hypothetical protein
MGSLRAIYTKVVLTALLYELLCFSSKPEVFLINPPCVDTILLHTYTMGFGACTSSSGLEHLGLFE